MSWGAVIGVAGGLIGNALSNRGARRGADAAAEAQFAAIDEQRRQYDQSREDMQPWLQAGTGALGRLTALSSGDMSGFYKSPGYDFIQRETIQGADRSAAARGGLYGGGHQADLQNRLTGLASNEFGNYWNQQAGLAGVGQTAAGGLASLGQSMASNVGNAYGNIGNARQSMYQQIGQNNAQLGYGLGGALNNWYQGRQAQQGAGNAVNGSTGFMGLSGWGY
jgi:hypothetical protein